MERHHPAYRVALGVRDEQTLHDGHFGESPIFLVFEIADQRARRLEVRRNVPDQERPLRHGDADKAQLTARIMEGVSVLAGKRFGPNVRRMLGHFVCVRVRAETVSEAVRLLEEADSEIRRTLEAPAPHRLIVLGAPSATA